MGTEKTLSAPWSRPSASEPGNRVAHPLHTVALLAIQAGIAVRGIMHANQARAAGNSNNIPMYVRTIIMEWALLAFVIGGVWLAKAPLTTVLGQRWKSARDVFRDIGIGVVFIILQQVVLSVLTAHMHGADADRAVRFLLPHGPVEMVLWLALSISAGICEEAIFRGYLQRQFAAFTQNVPAGILLSAAMFGFAHSYQGAGRAVVIGLDGAMLGALAHWCRSVRPGMVGHAFKDAVAPLIMARH
jgi:membrane protease YdiL (CAAX protease family)